MVQHWLHDFYMISAAILQLSKGSLKDLVDPEKRSSSAVSNGAEDACIWRKITSNIKQISDTYHLKFTMMNDIHHMMNLLNIIDNYWILLNIDIGWYWFRSVDSHMFINVCPQLSLPAIPRPGLQKNVSQLSHHGLGWLSWVFLLGLTNQRTGLRIAISASLTWKGSTAQDHPISQRSSMPSGSWCSLGTCESNVIRSIQIPWNTSLSCKQNVRLR